MLRLKAFLIVIVLFTSNSFSQSKFDKFLTPSDSLNKSRRTSVYISEAAIGGLTLIALNQLWYKDYERSHFHTFNDNQEWLQMDKMGHAFSAYQLGKMGSSLLNWSGASKKEQLIYGATIGMAFLTAVETLDGFSKEWGFSWGDMLANGIGTGLYVGQELLWEEQRISLKYSFHRTQFALKNPDKLGDGLLEEVLKDYNGQTYWLSFNLHAFTKNENIPRWLNVAVGFGAEGMTSAPNFHRNTETTSSLPYRQFYLSLDLDFSRIPTQSSLLRSIFDVLNVIKVPFPALEFNGKNDIKFHGIYF